MTSASTIFHLRSGEITNKSAVRKLFSQLSDGSYLCDVKKLDRRSNQQNRYLHGVLIPHFRMALNEVGYDEVKTDEHAKSIVKSMFLKRQTVNKETGEVIEYIQDTSALTKEEMNVFIDEVIKFSAENLNYVIPLPGEQMEMSF